MTSTPTAATTALPSLLLPPLSLNLPPPAPPKQPETLQQLDATPAVRLIDELMTMDPVADADAVRDRIQSAKEVTKGELAASLGMLLDGMSEQDEAFDAQVTKAAETEDPAEFQRILEHANGRMEAKRRLATLKEICEA